MEEQVKACMIELAKALIKARDEKRLWKEEEKIFESLLYTLTAIRAYEKSEDENDLLVKYLQNTTKYVQSLGKQQKIAIN